VKFQNGEPFNAQSVKFSFDRAAAANSTNKDKRTFANITTQVVDEHTVVLINKEIEPDLLFLLGQASAILVEPKTVDTNATKPVGTGPYRLDSWAKGSGIVLAKWDGFRNASAVQIRKASFRFISEPAAQTTALLSGDVDLFPHASVSRSLPQFENDKRFQVVFNASRGKTILAINNKRKPLDDVRVRRAIAAAIDRKAVIEAAVDGRGIPIGSHYVPGAPGYVDTTGVNPYDIEKAKKLLAEAGVKTPLELDLVLPPPPYARQGGELIAAQLAKIGIVAKIQNVEWAQWISGTYGNKNYDLSLILHVEPFDLVNYTKPEYYWGYQSARFNELFDKARNAARAGRPPALPWRRAAAAGRRRGQRVSLPAAVHHGGRAQPARPVEGRADLRERHRRALLGLTPASPRARPYGNVPRKNHSALPGRRAARE
jgi:peptide/nickel transport system substrate-binding protein